MDNFIFGTIMGILIGTLLGLVAMDSRRIVQCQNGWQWKDVDYSYSCTATKRP